MFAQWCFEKSHFKNIKSQREHFLEAEFHLCCINFFWHAVVTLL